MLKFHTDSYFTIGNAHLTSGKPAQDHALSGFTKDLACAVIADGCSSGGHTDVGARILTLATMQAMRDTRTTSIDAVAQLQKRILSSAQGLLGLRKGDLQATCAYACLTPAEGAVVHVQGDGAAAIKRRDGSIVIHHFEWANNAPFYPSYSALGEDWLFFTYQGARYIQSHPEILANEAVIPRAILADCEQYVETNSLDGISKDVVNLMVSVGQRYPMLTVDVFRWPAVDTTSLAVRGDDGAYGYVIRLTPEDLHDVELIAVFSDGVSQVDGMGWKSVIIDFLQMKNTNGEFVKRRMIRSIKDARACGKGPMDDISAAMICVEESDGQ